MYDVLSVFDLEVSRLSDKTTTTLEEKKAEVLIYLRGYKLLEKKEYKNALGYYVNTSKGKALI